MTGLKHFLAILKDYWFLITLIMSAIISVAYMIIFQVNPWDTQREIKHKRKLVEFHTLGGVSLLEVGQFKLAKDEFNAALALAATNEEALNGRYLADLFIALDSPDWDPSVGFAVQDQLTKLIRQQSLRHVIEMYLGHLHARTNQLEVAKTHYEKALELRPGYVDVLDTLGWFHYYQMPDLEKMEGYFRRLTEVSRYDYRGFHGLGYSYYMRALREDDAQRRTELMQEAAKQSELARDLSINRYNIKVDFGEVARSVNPGLSISYHTLAMDLLEDPKLEELSVGGIIAELLKLEGQVYIKGKAQLRAWINYQLAVDYLAMERLGYDVEGEKSHQTYLAKAQELDSSGAILPIYRDQVAILDFLTGPGGEAQQPLAKDASG